MDAFLCNQGSETIAIWKRDGKFFFTEIVGTPIIAEQESLS